MWKNIQDNGEVGYIAIESRQLPPYNSELYLSRFIIDFGGEDTVVLARGDGEKAFDSLGVLLTRRSVPEDDTVLNLVWLTKTIDQSVGEVAPVVVVADVGKVDEGANTQSNPQPSSLPGQSTQVTARNLECVKVLGEREREREIST